MESRSLQPLLLVVNPVAGRCLGKKYLADIVSALTERGFLMTVYVSKARGDSARFVTEHGRSFCRIVCVGGDGTLNETVTGMLTGGIDVPLGYIPAGSTNVFADSHHLSERPVRAAADAAADRVLSFDAGQFSDRYFAYVAAFGLFSCLSFTTPQTLKNRLGHTAYLLDGLRDLAQIHPEHVCITAGGIVHEGDYLFGAVCNATSLARTFEFPAGTVDMSDGQFEVILIRVPETALELQETVAALRTQNYAASRLIDFFHAENLRAECSPALEWTLDGEPASGRSEIDIRCLPLALRLVCP